MTKQLKTLKDIERESAGYLCDENTNEVFEENPNFILPDEARALAIKWVKEERVIKANKKEGLYDCFTQEERWMKRLNITEDDLK